MTSVVDELATTLFALRTEALTTRAVTAQITRAIVEWALGRRWHARTEARVNVERVGGVDPALGFVDVIVSPGGGEPDLAIEIDSADKPWSVVKLRHAASAGMRAVWVRWGDEEWAGIYDDVDVIQLLTLRRPARGGPRQPQLALWHEAREIRA